MLLGIDIGNTNLTIGLFEGAEIIMRWRIATHRDMMPDEYGMQFRFLLEHNGIQPLSIEGICIASVVPIVTGRVVDACGYYLDRPIVLVDYKGSLGYEILIDNPRELGQDRIIDAMAVRHQYGYPACLVDFGTATTFNLLNRDGNYIGGAIAPGINTSTAALTQKTAQLPTVAIARPPSVVGTNTIDSIQSGLYYGYISMVEGMAARYRREISPDMKIIATGGLSKVLAKDTDVFHDVNPWLTLTGLRLYWERNK